MQILQSITYYLPYVSGVTIYAQRLGEALVKRGYSVAVLTSQYDKMLPSGQNLGGVEIKRVNSPFSVSKGPIMPSWPLAVWQRLNDATVVLVHLPQFEGIITAFLAKLRRKPLVVIYHCEVTLPKGFFNSLVGRVLDWSQWLTCRWAGKIVVYTLDYAKHSRIASRFLDKTVQIYPPVTLAEQRKAIKIKKKRGELWIGFSGRVSTEKGLEYLIEAFQIVVAQLAESSDQEAYQGRPPQLVIAGPEPVGESDYVRKIKKLVKQIEQDVIFLGSLSQEELVSFYKQLDVLVLPSVNSTEAFGLVQVEAMLCGTPVVATDLPGVRVPVKKTGMGEIVPVADSKALAAAITRVIRQKERYLKPRGQIEAIFNFEQTVDAYESLLKHLS